MMATWKWWEAPEGTTSKRSKRVVSYTDINENEDEEEEDDEEEDNMDEDEDDDEDEYEDKPEPKPTCAFQEEWQDWDQEEDSPRWDWKCELVTNTDLRCRKEICPFWKGREIGVHPFAEPKIDVIDEIKSRKKRK
jgi:hypothetical protein